jgi:hypothetical protein
MRAQDYATEVQRLLQRGLPTPPAAATDLVQKAMNLDALMAGPAGPALEVAKQQLRAALTGLSSDIERAIADAVPIAAIADLLRDADLTGPQGLQLDATLGPLHVAVRSPSVVLVDPHDGGLLVLGPLPPNAFTGGLDAALVKGSGTLVRLPDGLSGVLTADLGFAQAAALASLRRVNREPSFLAVLSAGFTPGIQLGFGFQLGRVGGVVGVNRTLATDALSQRIADGSAAKVLFPLDIGKDARATLQAAEDLFRPSVGSIVAGPTFRLSWLEVAGTGFMSADVGVLVELPGPRRVALVGVVKAGIDKVIRLNANVAGVLDFAQERATVDAALVDSGALGIFTVYGDLAFATSWGPVGYTVLTMGGFYPGFRPEPAQLRPLKRLGLALDNPLPGLRLKAEGYIAATSNTLQMGGRLDVGYDAGIASLSGFIGVDALVQFTPFHIHADLAAGLDVRFLGQTFVGVTLLGTLDAPAPTTIAGRLTVETFLKDFHFNETWTLDSGGMSSGTASEDAIEVVAREVGSANLRSLGGADPMVLLAPVEVDGGLAVVTARNGVEWRQHAVPLETPVDRIAGTPLPSLQTVSATLDSAVLTGQQVRDRFAPGSFITLTAAEALNGPTYDDLPAGLRVTGTSVAGNSVPADNDLQVLRKVRGQGTFPAFTILPSDLTLAFAAGLLAMVRDRDDAATVANLVPQVTLAGATWLAGGSQHDSQTQAFQAAGLGGGAVLAQADFDQPIAMAGI